MANPSVPTKGILDTFGKKHFGLIQQVSLDESIQSPVGNDVYRVLGSNGYEAYFPVKFCKFQAMASCPVGGIDHGLPS